MANQRANPSVDPARGVAVKARLSDFGRRRFVVPLEMVLLVRGAGGQQRLVRAGEEVDTREPSVALLARTTRIAVPLVFDDLAAKDDFVVDAQGQVSVRVVPTVHDLALLLDHMAGESGQITASDVGALLETPCRACLTGFCREREAQALTDRDPTAEAEATLREAVAKATFTTGLEFVGLDRLRLTARPKGQPKRVIVDTARQFLMASGRQVAVYDPRAGGTPGVAYEFSGALGPLRSVRVVWINRERYLAGGARDGVYVVHAGAPGSVGEYRTAQPTRGRTGFNAVAVYGDRLFATHAEHGLVTWMLYDPSRAGWPLFPELTARVASCRQVQVADDARLVWAVDRQVFTLDLTAPNARPIVYRGAAGAVSAVVCRKGLLLAGTDRGEVLRWRPDAPEVPAEELLRREHAIYALALVHLNGFPHVAIGAKDHALAALRLDTLSQVLFRSPRWNVALVDGASDYLAAIDGDRSTLLVWDTASPAQPAAVHVVRSFTGHSIQDLACWSEPAVVEKT